MHQTIGGSVVSNGMRMEGISSKIFSKCRKAFAGDVHVPQKVGKVMYVGSPYHVHFGDYFNPRLVLLDSESGVIESIQHDKCPRKISLSINNPAELTKKKAPYIRPGDFVKVRVELPKHDFPLWREMCVSIKKRLKKLGAHERGVEVKEIKRVKLIRKAEQENHNMAFKASDYDILERFTGRENIAEELAAFGRDLL